MTTHIPYFSLHFLPLILAFFNGSCLQELLLWCLPHGDFPFRSFLPHLLVEIERRKSHPFSSINLFTQLFISVQTYGYLFCSMG